MRLRRRTARWLSGWLVVALLFMQFATAAFACPAVGHAAAASQAAPACQGHAAAPDGATPAPLCKAHCQQGQQAVNETAPADAPMAPLLLAVLDWAPALHATPLRTEAFATAAPGAPPPGAGPLYLNLLVLRN